MPSRSSIAAFLILQTHVHAVCGRWSRGGGGGDIDYILNREAMPSDVGLMKPSRVNVTLKQKMLEMLC